MKTKDNQIERATDLRAAFFDLQLQHDTKSLLML